MPTYLLRLTTLIAVVLTLSFAPVQADAQTTSQQAAAHHESGTSSTFQAPVNPGTLDLSIGLGGFFYNTIEPGVDLGLIPLGDAAIISLGGYLNAGYCLIGCSLLRAFMVRIGGVDDSLRIRAWHLNPMARGLVHLNILSEAIDMPALDVYGGLVAGPSYYNVHLSVGEASADFGEVSFLIGPMAGIRYSLGGGRGLFIYGEARYLVEFGTHEFVLELADGTTYTDNYLINRGGRNMHFGIGFRL